MPRRLPMYKYPRAGGPRAQPEVRAAIARFKRLPESQKRCQPLLYWLLGAGTPPYKMGKAESAYVQQAVGRENCANCIFAYQNVTTKRFICSQIEGDILPQAWCRLWVGGP